MKYLKSLLAICLLGLLFYSCVKKANYPDYPVITYNNFIPFCTGSNTDSAYLLVNFTDGNGAIGYSQTEASSPDFYILPEIYFYTGKFEPLINTITGDTIKYSYVIPDITPSGKDKELNGIIQINLENFIQSQISVLAEDTTFAKKTNAHKLQFVVWMFDRNGNKSNVITTPTVYSCQ